MEPVADPWSDPSVAERKLRSQRAWAVVGCSSNPARPSHGVSRFLIRQGYEVIPINPRETEVHGLTAYPDLASVPAEARQRIEVVDIFRRPDLVVPHVPAPGRSGCSSGSGTRRPPRWRRTPACSS
jgi:predicted CoA-binding protein